MFPKADSESAAVISHSDQQQCMLTGGEPSPLAIVFGKHLRSTRQSHQRHSTELLSQLHCHHAVLTSQFTQGGDLVVCACP